MKYLLCAVELVDDETGEAKRLAGLEIKPEDWERLVCGLRWASTDGSVDLDERKQLRLLARDIDAEIVSRLPVDHE